MNHNAHLVLNPYSNEGITRYAVMDNGQHVCRQCIMDNYERPGWKAEGFLEGNSICSHCGDEITAYPMVFDWKGRSKPSPKDLGQTIASYDDRLIVWSRSRNTHQVRYGLQVKQVAASDSIDAAQEFGRCVHHLEQCNGKLD